MIFSTTTFLLYFLPVFFFIYYCAPIRFNNIIILGGSIIFYSWGAPKFIFVVLIATYLDFYIVKKLHSTYRIKARKALLSLSIFINLGLLVYFKYANFFVENLNILFSYFGLNTMGWAHVFLPIGISFYTFQTLTYSIDVYRKTAKPLTKVSDYMLYIMSFPQMIAGPIVRFNSIASQIINRDPTYDDKLIGFYRFCIGLSKKVLIANVMAEQADLIFNANLENINVAEAWIGMLAYTFQIYFDFSGYSDMAIGLGKMLGFKFPENFDSPYVSKSISEFWRRWHITLGEFMRDYLYIPLGGNRVKNKYRLYFNLWIVFLASGLWHGAEWNFILWGIYHGLFLILDRLFLLSLLKKLGSPIATCTTFLLTMFGWVLFRIENITTIDLYFIKLFSFNSDFSVELKNEFGFTLIVAIMFSFFVNLKTGEKIKNYFFNKNHYSFKEHVILTIICLILFALSLSTITSSNFNPFIYFRF